MSLSMKDLQEVMAPLTEIGKGEATFEVNGLKVTVRTLTPEEEIATQRYARGALTEGDNNDQINALDYLDRLRAATLGYSIVQIGDTDFRGVDTIETGEKLSTGVAVKIKKNEAIIKVIEGWSRTMMTAVFQRFTSLLSKVEAQVEKSIQYDDDHIDAEIIRLEEKLAELKAEKTKRDAGKNDPRKDMLDAAAGKTDKPKPEVKPEKVTWETIETHTTDEPAMAVAVPSDIPRTLEGKEPLKPESLPPDATKPPVEATKPPREPSRPVEAVDMAPAPAPENVAPKGQRKPVFGDRPPPREAPPQEPKKPDDPLGDVQSSFMEDSSEVEAENRRLALERARRLSPKPPHQSAREVAEALEKPEAVGTKDGVPVFKMPTETLTPETKGQPQRPAAQPPRSNVNPHFRPAGKP